MKRMFSKGLILATLAMTTFFGAQAQTINMGSNPINFGTACNSSYIKNSSATAYLGFGINSFCVGPTFSADMIAMDLFNIRMGIGVTAPTFQLQLATNSAAKPGSSSWTIASDKRLKQDVNAFSDGLTAVRGIQPVTFHYNAASGYDTKPEYVGVLAQDLQKVAPYMVHESQLTDNAGKTTDILAVDLGAMDFVLVNAVKELDAELQIQRAQNEVLNATLATMQAQIDALKNTRGQHSSVITPSLTVSPNPVGTEANITCTLPANTRMALVQVIGLDGKEYASLTVSSSQTGVVLHTQDMPNGNYIVKLIADDKAVATARLITQH